jgi:hypothetical protein
MLPITTVHADEINLALGTMASEGIRVDLPALALEPGEVVVEEDPVEIRDVNPQTAAISTLSQRLMVPFELGHLDAATGAIHGAGHSPVGGSSAPVGFDQEASLPPWSFRE